ncbi:hypothetical protein CANARDRAFT_6494 [[Candida] arabinofermentans NRRL YB-2248]|uniref:Oligomycin resistance ATP-dependent permease YOR1 n=1 Tax=[Candida] arabinofermentans NRRL YB-2248 TaxID=983967 RepID=A0A1E4T581_9ASCO|nr:hypothetical protein CANARDRAFT_6494 [[Candida] arabinofermentans NRRL YB-2248]
MADDNHDKLEQLERGDPKKLVLQKRTFTFLFSKEVPPLPTQSERVVFPHTHANILSRVLFSWMFPMMKVGYKRTILPNDLYLLEEDMTIEYMYAKFKTLFDKDVTKLQAIHIENKLKERGEDAESSTVEPEEDLDDFQIPLKVLVKNLYLTFWFDYTKSWFIKSASDIAGALSPLLQKQLINFVEKRAYGVDEPIRKGVGYALGCSFFVLFIGITINHFFYHSMTTGAKVKAVLTKAMLEKGFKLSAKGHHDFPVGKVNSLLGTDLSRIDFAIGFFPFLLVFPIPVTICIVLLIINIGVSALVGIGLFVVVIGGLGSCMRFMFRFRKGANYYTDRRVNLVKELLKNFKTVKFYSWEDAYEANLSEARNKEMNYIFKLQSLRNVMASGTMTLPTVSSMVAFLVLYGLNSSRSVGSIFSSLTLFQVLAQQFMLVPMALALTTDMAVGLRRVCEYLSCSEIDEKAEVFEKIQDPSLALKVDHATFQWRTFEYEEEEDPTNASSSHTDSDPDVDERKLSFPDDSISSQIKETEGEKLEETKFAGLVDISLEIKKGEFIVVTGSIGSGKSSLLSAISGFMPKVEGTIAVDGDMLLCGYPWVQNATVRDNILFGLEYDKVKYEKVINACSLRSDFNQLPGGDMSEIGERGITLSGGQKARINLARAVYADKDIILLDDVLSAVDAKVGKHIMEECIMGLLGSKTRVLATHQLSLIGSADRILFMNGDGSIDLGTFKELSEKNSAFVKLMEFSKQSEEDEEEEVAEEEIKFNEEQYIQRSQTAAMSMKDEEPEGKLVKDEEQAVNGIQWEVYKTYLNLGSGIFKVFYIPLVLMMMILATFFQLFTNTWLSFWTSNKFPGRSDGFYIGLYVMFCMLYVIFLSIEFYLMVYFTTNASRNLNVLASSRLLHAPMVFLDTSPLGRILNRFTKDTDVLDNEILEQIKMFFFSFCNICGVVILCIIYLPWFAIAVPVLVLMYYAVASFYQASSREVKRIEATKRSFVYSHFNETLDGMNTIKAYKATERFLDANNQFLNNQNEAYYVTIANQRWLAISLDMIATAFALLISLLCCFRVFHVSGSSTGLLLSYVLTIAGTLSIMLRSLTQVENEMNSVERLKFYAKDLAQEAAYRIPERDPAPSWPEHGAIEFQHVSMKYRPELPYILKDLNMYIKPNEKIGVCGRTGAGKSSLMACLYRVTEPEGNIFIDDVDISKLGLHALRSKLSIIPQDPVLFTGTIRSNLDPFMQKSDDELWSALRRSNLIEENLLERVKMQTKADDDLHKFHLDQSVEDDGSNFSLGERQLLALARALVRAAKILILDEATSSVDYETDAKIQKTIVNEFSNCTILCIAHRLKTIVNYDRILTLENGAAVEFDTPLNLYNKKDGLFRSMCDKSGIKRADIGA